jgi:hypothetical protein
MAKKASAARERKRKGRGWQTLSVKVKIRLASPIGFIVPWAVLSGAHAPRALTAGKFSLADERDPPRLRQLHACTRAIITAW